MPYIDLHCHPGLKALFKLENNRLPDFNTWNYRTTKKFGLDALAKNIIRSQSSYSQIINCSNLIVAALHPIESGMINNSWIKGIAPSTVLMDTERIMNIINFKLSPFSMLKEELKNLRDTDPSGKNRKVKIIKKISEYDRNDTNTIHVILSVEGGHAYFDQDYDKNDTAKDNYKSFLNQNKVLYQTITHAIDNPYANHAWANKILPKFHYYPTGNGLTSKGMEFIAYLREQNVLIDIKHMSLISRLNYYDWRRNQHDNSPIIFSHGAFTGKSYTKIFDQTAAVIHPDITKFKMSRNQGELGYAYNPASINLFDEEIIEVFRSGGLFGLILDVRILGFENKKDAWLTDFEFVSTSEFNKWVELWDKDNKSESFEHEDTDFDSETEDMDTMEDMEIQSVYYRTRNHIDYFIQQIVHAYIVCENAKVGDGNLVLNHICIGSDFDGLIKTMDKVDSASEMDNLKKSFIDRVTELRASDDIPWQMNAEILADKIFETNLLNFLNKHFI